MDFEYSSRTEELKARIEAFMDKNVYPNEKLYYDQIDDAATRWSEPPILKKLKEKAQADGLWNLFLPESDFGAGLTNLEYAPLCEVMGRVQWAPEIFNCSAPDTGNMETLERYGSEEQKTKWLRPLLDGKIRSAFAMTEPKVASSDATNIETSIVREGDEYVINGHKWWTSGIGSEECKILILMGKTEPHAPKYNQQSMILIPRRAKGIKVLRMLKVMGFDDAPHGHGELIFENVRVPASNILLGEGRGFEIAPPREGRLTSVPQHLAAAGAAIARSDHPAPAQGRRVESRQGREGSAVHESRQGQGCGRLGMRADARSDYVEHDDG